jgi:hypothetical protein
MQHATCSRVTKMGKFFTFIPYKQGSNTLMSPKDFVLDSL